MTAFVRPEKSIQDEILFRLNMMRGVIAWRNNNGVHKVSGDAERGTRTRRIKYGLTTGASDLLGIVRAGNGVGRFFAVECKRDSSEKPTIAQVEFLREVNARGGYGIVAWSWAQVEAAVCAARAGEPAPPPPAPKPDPKPMVRRRF